jgi:polyphosphate kinase 2 (PPK2 family)
LARHQDQWRHWRQYDRFVEAAEEMIKQTSLANAPWTIVEGADDRYRSLAVATTIRDAIRKRLPNSPGAPAGAARGKVRAARGVAAPLKPLARRAKQPTILGNLDMSQHVDRKAYRTRLERLQGRLNALHRRAQRRGTSAILVFEGWDAAGKGGAVRRVTAAIDARAYQVIPIAAPTDEERAQHYLWRFWRHLARKGRFTIFDRSWYGRVLVERVEGFAAEHEWMRAYAEINQFESQLVAHDIAVVKLWMHVTKDEQLRRFKERKKASFKRWKLTHEDWRNRKQWDVYQQAVNDMVERTSTRQRPGRSSRRTTALCAAESARDGVRPAGVPARHAVAVDPARGGTLDSRSYPPPSSSGSEERYAREAAVNVPVKITVNGQRFERTVEPRLLLVHFLRDVVGLTG